jgi:hypothetical protein
MDRLLSVVSVRILDAVDDGRETAGRAGLVPAPAPEAASYNLWLSPGGPSARGVLEETHGENTA